MSSSEDWEEAVFSDDKFIEIQKTERLKSKTAKILLLHNVLKAINDITDFEIDIYTSQEISNEEHSFIRITLLNNYMKNIENLENPLILYFKLLLYYKIPCRILCNINVDSYKFLEVNFYNEKISNKKLYKGNVLSLDCNFEFKNLSNIYSSDLKNQKIFEKLINELQMSKLTSKLAKEFSKLNIEAMSSEYFETDNDTKLKLIPKSSNRLKKHPLYIVESLLKENQIIHPKRPVLGYLKGEPIYYKKNVQNLKTEKQLYKNGQMIISDKPFRIINKNNEKIYLYAKWQCDSIIKQGFGKSRFMDYFHENHKPIDCVYIKNDNAQILAKQLNISHKECLVGFSYKQPIIDGIFIKTEDAFFFCNALKEYNRNLDLDDEIENTYFVIELWKKLIKRVKKYEKIKKRIGI